MSGSVVIRRCASIEEALVVLALLRDGGFIAHLDNWHHSTMDWGKVVALGGVGVRVPESQLMPAAEYMIDMVRSAEMRLTEATGSLETTPLRRRRLRTWSMFLLYISGGVFPLLPLVMLLALVPQSLVPEFEFGAYSDPSYGGGLGGNLQALPTFVVLALILLFTLNEFSIVSQLSIPDEEDPPYDPSRPL